MIKKDSKKDKLSTHKKLAWKSFSTYIRTRDCLKTTGTPTRGTCVTCQREYDFKELQAGHWIPGRNNAVLFSEQGVHAQCGGCNQTPPFGKGGNPIEYWQYMERTYGRKVMDQLIEESHQTVVYKKYDYDNIAEKYRQKTLELVR